MVHDSCRDQASSLDTENTSNVIRNTNWRKKDCNSDDCTSLSYWIITNLQQLLKYICNRQIEESNALLEEMKRGLREH